MPHKRNGRVAQERRQVSAVARQIAYNALSADEKKAKDEETRKKLAH